ncbi:hypothetical protein Poli38472_007252 [Pythium oligandrum]|uniref:M96 mating-specific protein family n=1 Tax=Pythium oligandrum TaxID=41045 RepID=A0A8K1C9M2_PYTOL|nr:hypothetical protein Poli38472_007252 [Pythium oligandrum]|eukprot:TMW59107.1 hypothetical protein Poli38472_007252 [Pythium oligandrum]
MNGSNDGQELLENVLSLPSLDESLDFLLALDGSYLSRPAALQFSAPDSSYETQETTATEPSNPKKRKKTRVNKSQELAYLRSTVVELEDQLAALRQEKGETEEPGLRFVESVWEGVATRQQEQRASAEAENTVLRKLLKAQIRVAKRFERLLGKRPYLEFLATPATGTPRTSALDRDSLVDELLASTLQMYSRVDSVLTDPRFHVNTDKSGRQIHLHSEPETFIDVLETRRFPFDYRRTADALWAISQRREHHLSWKARSEKFHTSTDSVVVKSFDGTVRVRPQHGGEFRATLVQQRFEEVDRIVIVSHLVAEPRALSEEPVHGVLVHLRSWQTLKRGPDDSTRMQGYHIARPEVVELAPNQHTMVGAITDFVFLAIDVVFDSDLQLLENQLLLRTTTSA